MVDFTLDDLNSDLDQDARNVITDVILSWARFDSLVSQLTLLAFGLALDGGTIFLGAMDTRTKLERLKKLYQHHGMDDAAQSIANLSQWHKEYVDVRNLIAHHTCAGCWKSKPSMIVFAPVRTRHRELDTVEIEHIPLDLMRLAVRFATNAGNALMEAVEPLALRRALPPPKPPAFQPLKHPTPRKIVGRKRPQPPEPS